MNLIVTLLFALVVFAIVWYVIGQLSLPPPIRMVAIVIMAIAAILLLLRLMPGISLT